MGPWAKASSARRTEVGILSSGLLGDMKAHFYLVIPWVRKSSRNYPQEDDDGGQEQESQVKMGLPLPPHHPPTKTPQPGYGALHNPPLAVPCQVRFLRAFRRQGIHGLIPRARNPFAVQYHHVLAHPPDAKGSLAAPMYTGNMVFTERVPLTQNEAGDLYVEGSRVFLEDLIDLYRQGYSPEEMALAYPSLKLADLYAVLAYVLRHPAEVEAYLERQGVRAREAEKKTRSHRSTDLRKRLEERKG